MHNAVPAHIIVGQPQQTEQEALKIMTATLCTTGSQFGTCFCSACKMLHNHQHPSLLWLMPEKNYTVETLEPLFDKIRFALDADESFYTVFAKADALTDATANRLLKILEEPPRGYKFLLLVENDELLLPTIISRCTIKRLISATQHEHVPPLLKMFMQQQRPDPLAFEAELKAADLDDRESKLLFSQLLAHYQQAFVRASGEGHDCAQLEIIIDFLLKRAHKPPQSGSSTFFWKLLFLTFPFEL